MTNTQTSKQSMLHVVLRVLEENDGIYSSIPALKKAVEELKVLIAEIDNAAELQLQSNVKSATAEKTGAETTMVIITVVLANALYALAIETDNEALLPKTRMTKSMLYNTTQHEAITLAQSILTIARDNASGLVDYGIDSDFIDKFEESIASYERQIAEPRYAIAERKSVTAQLVALFAKSDTLLNDRIDKMMSLFKISDPSFYAVYFNARNIINTASRKQKADAQETPADTSGE